MDRTKIMILSNVSVFQWPCVPIHKCWIALVAQKPATSRNGHRVNHIDTVLGLVNGGASNIK